MQRRKKAWNGNPPATPEAARRYLLSVAQELIERLGFSKVGLSDVASAAGVTRQTVYRHFASTDELFNAAAVLASGGFLERMRKRVLERDTVAERFVETLVLSVCEIPKDPHLSVLAQSADAFTVSAGLKLQFVQEEMLELSAGKDQNLNTRDRDELAELMLRLLRSFLIDTDPERTEDELRDYLHRWLLPIIEDQLR